MNSNGGVTFTTLCDTFMTHFVTGWISILRNWSGWIFHCMNWIIKEPLGQMLLLNHLILWIIMVFSWDSVGLVKTKCHCMFSWGTLSLATSKKLIFNPETTKLSIWRVHLWLILVKYRGRYDSFNSTMVYRGNSW